MVVPEPAAGWREGRVDAPGRGEGEGGVASEISREKFLESGKTQKSTWQIYYLHSKRRRRGYTTSNTSVHVP